MKENILNKDIAFCEKCRGLVKPDIVFFGESVRATVPLLTQADGRLQLPDKFIHAIPSVKMADLLLIIGTSLTVHPFASLAGLAEPLCPRVLINLEKVGDLGHRPDDVLLLGKCDEVVKDLCRELGWEEELMNLWAETEMKEVETINAVPKAPATFRVLKGNGIKAVAEYMKSKDCRNVIVMVIAPSVYLFYLLNQMNALQLGAGQYFSNHVNDATDVSGQLQVRVPLLAFPITGLQRQVRSRVCIGRRQYIIMECRCQTYM